jgi:hypothetical protein
LRPLQQAWRLEPTGKAERRLAPRCDAHLAARLHFSLSLREAEAGRRSDASKLPGSLAGFTRNISETGLSLVVASSQFCESSFDSVGKSLRIMLELPAGKVRIHATLVRCEPLKDEADQNRAMGYLMSACITEMKDSEWVRLVQYVRTLR